MPKFSYNEIGDEGVAFLHIMGSQKPARYWRAVEGLVNYGGTSFGQVIQNIDANGIQPGGRHLYSYDPATYAGSALRAALEDYGDAREAELKRKAEARRKPR